MEQPKLFIQDNNIKPLKDYPGSKAGSGGWQKIISEIPRCQLFIEAMAGSAFISSLVQSTGCSIVINDRDRSVIDRIIYPAEKILFTNEDYQKVIQRYDNGNQERVFYFDPPYLMGTRKSQLPLYNFDWNDRDHTRFLKALQAMKSPAMVSHYPNQKYDKALKKWRKITYNSMTRAGVRKETLYMNFPPPVLLQCYKHVGTDFTDRQRIKRKVDRLVNRLKNEPEKERAAILSSIIDRFTYVISGK